MFYFHSIHQNPQNISYYKGLLFEQLLRDFLISRGYDCKLSRTKLNSLEYDIVGANTTDGRPIIGEAKAHEGTISGETIAAFVGKLAPHHYSSKHGVSGLFFSISSISPDADDYFRKIQHETPFQIQKHVGAELEYSIVSSLGFPDKETVSARFQSNGLKVHAINILATDDSSYLLVLGSRGDKAFSDCFAILNKSNQIIDDQKMFARLRDAIPAIQDLDPFCEAGTTVLSSNMQRAEIPKGLITADSWLDYRHPASPRFFVGRVKALEKAQDFLSHGTCGSVVEVKSKSGVGKSSILIALADQYTASKNEVELHDSRDVHSQFDVLRIVERFCNLPPLGIQSFEGIESSLANFSDSIHPRRAIFLVDQFEATFQNPEVFRAYEYVAMCIIRCPANIGMAFARKDDLLTTHDDLQISVERIRDLSKTIALDDFDRDDAASLISLISESMRAKLQPALLNQVLEFTQGFPWLIKRTMAHIAKTISGAKSSQHGPVTDGLHLEDLFQEELEELDEIERGYLKRLVPYLPATYNSILTRFEGDPQLPRMLEQLTHRRILRFSSGTYDTYNDVFKDFILYDRVPDRDHSLLFKIGPIPIFKAFKELGGDNKIDVAEYSNVHGKSIGATYNILRELRIVGLITKSGDSWIIPEVVRQYEHQNRLGEYVRQSLLKNLAVSTFLATIERETQMNVQQVNEYLQSHFPYTQAKPEIWNSYTRTFLLWLEKLGFINLNRAVDPNIVSYLSPKATIELGNLNINGRGLRANLKAFLPSKNINELIKLLVESTSSRISVSSLTSTRRIVSNELVKLGAVEISTEGYIVVKLTQEEFEGKIKTLLSQSPYSEIWKEIHALIDPEISIRTHIIEGEFANGTISDMAKRLVNWGLKFGFINRRTGRRIVDRGLILKFEQDV